MEFEIAYPPGATPLDPNEIEGLIPDFVSTHGELNTLENENILEATTWAFGRKNRDVLEVSFVYALHKRMLGRVWQWAGTPRRSDKNIGVAWSQIPTRLAQLLADTKYWLENKTYPWDELGARFHHRLVSIHVFPNGNGLHARLITDILLTSHGQEIFTWGRRASPTTLDVEGTLRKDYIAALEEADAKQFQRLIRFVRS